MKKIIHLGFAHFLLDSCSNDNGPDPEVRPAPFASFTASAATVDAGSSVIFDNTSLNVTTFLWLFPGGDPNMSTEENPTVTYDAGTDSGSNFTSADDDTDPADNISKITDAPLGNGSTVDPPMAMFTFVKGNVYLCESR